MAMPTSNNNVTVRKLVSVISSLWDKVKNAFLLKTSRGAANGVASLDANGKVPSSQLPTVPSGNLPSNSSSSAGIVASGSEQSNKIWMTDSSGNPSWRLGSTQFLYDYKLGIGGLGPNYIHIGILTPRGTGGDTDQLLFSGIGDIVDYQKLVFVQVLFRGSSPDIKSTVLDGSTTNQTLFGFYKDSNNVYHLMMKLANWSSTSEFLRVLRKGNAITFDLYNLDSEPANVSYIDNYYVTRSPMGQSVGNTTTPVYVDSDGNIKKCTKVAANTANYPAGFASRRTSLDWGTLTSGNGYTTVTGWYATDSAEIGFAKKSGALSVQIDGVFYQRDGVRRVLDTSDLGNSIPVIEHVTAIPVNPTVGTIYAL